MALGLNVVVGMAGLLDLGYVAFFAVGAYCSGWLGSTFVSGADVHVLVNGYYAGLPGIHVNFLLVLAVAAVVAAALGVLIGYPTLRLRGDYIAIVTLAFGEIIARAARNGTHITAGTVGIRPIDAPELPVFGQLSELDTRRWYYLALLLVVVALFIGARLRDSRLGRAWTALRSDEDAAACAGVPLRRVKLTAYAIGAAMGAVSGAFLGAYTQQVNSDQFDFSFSIFVLVMVVLGGAGSVGGVVAASLALSLFTRVPLPGNLTIGIYGVVLVLVALLRAPVSSRATR